MTTIDTLYTKAIPAKRTGHLYGAFPYPTKISPEAIALFIAAHNKPGDTVFDGFASSATTGLAALPCEDPPKELRPMWNALVSMSNGMPATPSFTNSVPLVPLPRREVRNHELG